MRVVQIDNGLFGVEDPTDKAFTQFQQEQLELLRSIVSNSVTLLAFSECLVAMEIPYVIVYPKKYTPETPTSPFS